MSKIIYRFTVYTSIVNAGVDDLDDLSMGYNRRGFATLSSTPRRCFAAIRHRPLPVDILHPHNPRESAWQGLRLCVTSGCHRCGRWRTVAGLRSEQGARAGAASTPGN